MIRQAGLMHLRKEYKEPLCVFIGTKEIWTF
nr:MAG TPA: hypothetical protein [Caudoviricetes sp.]